MSSISYYTYRTGIGLKNNTIIMKSIINTINEGKKIKIEENIDFDVRSDIYNVLSALAYEYDKAGQGGFDDKREVAAALDWFMSKFYDAE